MNEDVSVAILAGGLSSRMGRDKGMVELAGKPLIAHVIEQVSRLSLPIILIANQPERYSFLGLPVLPDVFPERSSLNGLYSAVCHSQSDYTLCLACDMPFLNPALLAYLLSLRAGWDAVVPLVEGHPQALHALYRRTCLAPMRRLLEQNRLKIRDLYADVHTRWLGEDALRRYNPDLTAFENINTPDALRTAESRLKSSTIPGGS
jgi:molybdopterin-guanine dinucleotide biosynthesis protein A